MKLGKKLQLILMLNLVLNLALVTPTSSVPMTKAMKTKILPPKEYAAFIAKTEYNWGAKQQKCLRALWGKESAWNFKAKSPTHDYGIPQRHMKHNTKIEIQKFLNNPRIQIDWGLNYIKSRYGSPCQAWSFHGRNNWY